MPRRRSKSPTSVLSVDSTSMDRQEPQASIDSIIESLEAASMSAYGNMFLVLNWTRTRTILAAMMKTWKNHLQGPKLPHCCCEDISMKNRAAVRSAKIARDREPLEGCMEEAAEVFRVDMCSIKCIYYRY